VTSLGYVAAPEEGRQAAHVLLDCLTTLDVEATPDTDLIDLALQRLDDVGAVTITIDDDDVASVDASNLVGPALVIMQWLIGRVAVREGRSIPEVVADLRDFWT
jgi:hypothetical protein